jgi:hypothetical protein
MPLLITGQTRRRPESVAAWWARHPKPQGGCCCRGAAVKRLPPLCQRRGWCRWEGIARQERATLTRRGRCSPGEGCRCLGGRHRRRVPWVVAEGGEGDTLRRRRRRAWVMVAVGVGSDGSEGPLATATGGVDPASTRVVRRRRRREGWIRTRRAPSSSCTDQGLQNRRGTVKGKLQ